MTGELTWFKSSYSDGEGGQCLEVALEWRKSSHSGGEGGQCVEIAPCPERIHVRDSKDTSRPGFTVPPAAWTSFLAHAAH